MSFFQLFCAVKDNYSKTSVTFVPQSNKEHRKDNKKLKEEFKNLDTQLVKALSNLSDSWKILRKKTTIMQTVTGFMFTCSATVFPVCLFLFLPL